MTILRIFTTATVALSALAAIGCSTPRANQYAEATPAPIYVPAAPAPAPEPIMTAEVVPAPLPPASTPVAVSYDPPVVMASNAPVYTTPTVITERAPRADRH